MEPNYIQTIRDFVAEHGGALPWTKTGELVKALMEVLERYEQEARRFTR